jgi:hypothetical protein
MFCPSCKAEYRSGFTRCADCDVELVYELPVAAEEPSHDPQEIVWSGDSQQDCVAMCEWFRERGIPYTVNQRRKQIWAGGIKEDYDILVPPEFASRVKADFEKVEEDSPSEEDAEQYLSLPDDPAAPVEAEPRDFAPWFPENATAEVYSEPIGSARDEDESRAGMIEMSLRENLIHSRSEDSNGSRKVFVLPEDEPRAREIVQEVTTGSPPV